MGKQCERCHKDLRFLEQTLRSDYPRLGIEYSSVCGNCHRTISAAVRQLEAISEGMHQACQKTFGIDIRQADLGQLILLAGAGLFEQVTQWKDDQSSFNQIFLGDERKVRSESDRLYILIFRILRLDYAAALGYHGVDTLESFLSYAAAHSRYFEDIGANYEKGGRRGYADLLATENGLFVAGVDAQNFLLGLKPDDQFRPRLDAGGPSFEVRVGGLKWPDIPRSPVFYFTRQRAAEDLERFLSQTDQRREEAVRKKVAILLKNINQEIEKDLTDRIGGKKIEEMDLDQVLLATTRILMDQPYEKVLDGNEPEGLFEKILKSYYEPNLRRARILDHAQVEKHLKDDFIILPDLEVSQDAGSDRPAWGMFGPKGYFVSYTDQPDVFYEVRESVPNDLYAHNQKLVLGGKERLFLDRGGLVSGSGSFHGPSFYSKDPKVMRALRRFFKKHEYAYLRSEEERLRRQNPTLRRSADTQAEQLMVNFGLLPFVLTDEYEALEEELRKEDLLLRQYLRRPGRMTGPKAGRKKGSKKAQARKNEAESTYAKRVYHEFNRCAVNLQEEIRSPEISPARVFLWEAVNDELRKQGAAEWKRVAGDLIDPYRDTVESALRKYLSRTDLPIESAYTLGLFTLGLMGERILKETDYLAAYETVRELYRVLAPGSGGLIIRDEAIQADAPEPETAEKTENTENATDKLEDQQETQSSEVSKPVSDEAEPDDEDRDAHVVTQILKQMEARKASEAKGEAQPDDSAEQEVHDDENTPG